MPETRNQCMIPTMPSILRQDCHVKTREYIEWYCIIGVYGDKVGNDVVCRCKWKGGKDLGLVCTAFPPVAKVSLA